MRNQRIEGGAVAKVLAIVLLLAITSSCDPVPCLHPLYTENDVVEEPMLLGIWAEGGDAEKCLWIFEKPAQGGGYTLTWRERDSQQGQEFKIHLVRLGTSLFLDAIETDRHDHLLLPVHMFGRIWITPDEVQIRMLDDEWLKKAIEAGRVDLRHERTDEGIVLTAETRELQNLAMVYAEDEEAFSVKVTLHRVELEPAR